MTRVTCKHLLKIYSIKEAVVINKTINYNIQTFTTKKNLGHLQHFKECTPTLFSEYSLEVKLIYFLLSLKQTHTHLEICL